MKKIMLCGLAALIAVCLLSYDLPNHWFKAGSDPDKYDMGIDPKGGMNGGNAATIKSTEIKIRGFGTLMQNSIPNKYLGKKVRMTGKIKSADVKQWAGMWFRVDGPSRNKSLAFDNMGNRPIKGTTDWKEYEIILDVPNEAMNLAYGVLLDGTGQVWFDDLKFEVVTENTPTTNIGRHTLEEPSNLNFEEK